LRQSVEQEAHWQQKIETAQERQAVITARRAQITATFQECTRLQRVIDALNDSLPLHIRGWQVAETLLAQAQERVGQLQALADTLPRRIEQRTAWQKMAESLTTLETWEAEQAGLQRDLEAKQQALEEFDALQTVWEAGEAQRANQQQVLVQSRETLYAAEQEWNLRQAAEQRFQQMRTLIGKIEACERAVQTQEEIERRLIIAQSEAERLPELRKRKANLEDMETRLRQRDEDRRELTRAQTNLEALRKQQTDQRERQERIALLIVDIERLEREIEAAAAAERQTTAQVRETDIRAALENWAEAAERVAEFSPETTADRGLGARLREAEAELASADQAVRQAIRRPLPGYALLAIGVTAGIVGAGLGQIAAAIVLAIVFIALGSLLTVRGQKAIRAVEERSNAAKLAFATLEGERKSAEARAQSNTEQRGLWANRESVAREALSCLETPVPATPAAARTQAQTLTPLTVVEAQTAQRVAAESASRLRVEQEATRRTKESESDLLRRIDPAALAEQAVQAQENAERLKAALAKADDLPDLAVKLGVAADISTLYPALEQARKVVSIAEAQEVSLPGLESEIDAKRADVRREQEQGKVQAEELGLASAEPTEWRADVESDREELRRSKTLTPNHVLESTVETARQVIRTVDVRLAGLAAEQTRRQETLMAKPRAVIAEEQTVLEEALSRATKQIEPLRSLRPTLVREELPTQAHALNLHIATHNETLRKDTETSTQLPSAREQQEECRRVLTTKQMEFQQAWQMSLPSAAPDTTLAAHQALPRWRTDFERRLTQQDEPALQMEEKVLRAENTSLERDVAALQHQQKETVRQQQSLRQELGMEPTETLQTLPSRLPGLQRAGDHTPDAWATLLIDAEDAQKSNRSERRLQAQICGVDEEALVLSTAEAELATAEQEIAVKRRAGEIIEKTRQTLISRVMPLTEQNVGQLLPLLTEGRYGDVKWDEATSSLEVYDTRARAYQRKRVFSGGARDQISLALRLGFALATLPGEHNIRPGWLFLDEPLSSFDRVRTLALVDLLTKGLIRRKFDQIFLVSHSEAFDPALFDHRVRMESGSVIENNLPVALAV
ncbi:MAG: hypothetical protein JWN14_2248, partial [Chthonomonadales bacterium]|nr:hypothetical protein [Chthonomonadales bacterium]